jgi:hypothetical protein
LVVVLPMVCAAYLWLSLNFSLCSPALNADSR